MKIKQKDNIEREQTTIRLPAELKYKLRQEADKKGICFNQFILSILEQWFAQKK